MKILFLVNVDWYFKLHWLSLARRMRDMGAQVVVMTQINDLEESLKQEGFQVISWRLSRRSLNPFRELLAFLQVLRVYRSERPDLVNHITNKAVVYGGLVARFNGKTPWVSTMAGLGHVFADNSVGMRFLRRCLLVLFGFVLRDKRSMTIFQNRENLNQLVKASCVAVGQAVVIPGPGVNLSEFLPQPEPQGTPVVLLASRMLWDKGVGEFVGAAAIIQKRGIPARFVLVGDPDPSNPASVPEAQLQAWKESGCVEWWGRRNDMPAVFAQSNIACLPSYYSEGLPRVLAEAASCGRVIVTTDTPGCHDVVNHGLNGLLVPPRDADALAEALVTLLNDPPLRAQMASRAREIAIMKFSEEEVFKETLDVFRRLLGPRWPDDFPTAY